MSATIKNRTVRSKSDSHRSTTSSDKTEILVNVYDLLPQGKLPSLLWYIGIPLLHTGVVIKRWNREFAFGGHDFPGISGVYSTHPRKEPPGGTFRHELLQGFTFRTDDELSSILKEAMQKFQGTTYDLLNCNCNHFTYFLCVQLTNKSPPAWLNRAASIARPLRCVVPREWITAPDYASADGGLSEEDEEDDGMLLLWNESNQSIVYHEQLASGLHDQGHGEESRRYRDNNNRSCCTQENNVRTTLPRSERAPLPVQRE